MGGIEQSMLNFDRTGYSSWSSPTQLGSGKYILSDTN